MLYNNTQIITAVLEVTFFWEYRDPKQLFHLLSYDISPLALLRCSLYWYK